MAHKKSNPADYIVPLSIGGLEGRMLHIPALPQAKLNGKKREVLFVYGHHSSLERWWGLMEVFSTFGNVTMPDLPGFGGMDSFYKIGQTASLDNMADYLAAFIKWRFKRKKVVIAGMSFGFVVVTRMLQRFPELTSKVELLISVAGFAHEDDFLFSRRRLFVYRSLTSLLASGPVPWLFRHTALTAPVLRLAYAYVSAGAKRKFAQAETKADFKQMMQTEISLWQSNDVRTHWRTAADFLRLDNCKVRVDLPVWHVYTENDNFLNNTMVEQHYQVIFNDYHDAPTALANHAPSVIADAEMAAPLVPDNLRQALLDLA